jgi:hypothetical protein
MPTYGWIYEQAVERALQGSESVSVATAWPESSRIACPFCTRTLEDKTEWQRHITVEHPIEPPVLLVGGRPLWKAATFRRALSASAITCANVTRIRVGAGDDEWTETDEDGLRYVLSQARDDTLGVELVNERHADGSTARRTTFVRFEVPDEASLRTVDAAFIEYLARNDLRFDEHVVAFDKGTSHLAGAARYRCALADFATGVCVRDGDPTTTLSRPQGNDKLRAAAGVLRDYPERAVARIALVIARIALGDPETAFPETAVPRLDAATSMLRALAGHQALPPAESSIETREEVALCPVDALTAQLAAGLASARTLDGQAILRGLADGTGGVEVIIARSALLATGARVTPAVDAKWRRSIWQDGAFAGWMGGMDD